MRVDGRCLWLLAVAWLPTWAVAESEQSPPDPELLEFLGSFAPEDRAWLDHELIQVKTAPQEASGEEQEHE
jgi:hypothetical protein